MTYDLMLELMRTMWDMKRDLGGKIDRLESKIDGLEREMNDLNSRMKHEFVMTRISIDPMEYLEKESRLHKKLARMRVS